jgi:hypothetical protein
MSLENTAIQSDVDKDVQEVVVGNTERNDALNSITERARQERDKELEENGHAVIDTSGEVKKEEEKIEPEDEVINEVKEVTEEIKPETVRIKVDGEEREVPKDKVYDAGIRAMQKESAADKRLEEATRLLKEAETRYAQVQDKPENPPQQWDDATVAYVLEHGNDEQKAYAVSLLRGRDTATPDDIVRQAEARVMDKIDFRDASQWFLDEYKDIAADPYLFHLASTAEDSLLKNGDTRSRKEIYKAIGDDLRKWKGGMTETKSMEEKKEQKSNIVNLNSASVKKSAPTENKPKTPSEIIEDMRKRRGQR